MSSSKNKYSFDFKDSNVSLLSLRVRTTDLQRLDHELSLRYGDTPHFFDGEGVVIDLSNVPQQLGLDPSGQLDDEPSFATLKSLLSRHKLQLVGVRGGTERQTAAAVSAGLLHVPGTPLERMPHTSRTPTPSYGGAVPPTIPSGALVIDKQLRCGQRVYARKRDLVIMAMVNPGAEVVSDGHIHIYAPLRGTAIAGAQGDQAARIFALNMAPELLSIAGVYCTGDAALSTSVQGKAAQISLETNPDGERLVAELIAQPNPL